MPFPEDLLRANARQASAFTGGDLPRPPRRGLAVLTCMDARIDPLALLGLAPGDANVLRNAGARVTDDVVRSLVVAQRLLGVEEVLVVGHTDCGLEGVTSDELRARVRASGGPDLGTLELDPFPAVEDGVRDAVARLRAEPLLVGLVAAGAVYDVATGRLREVRAAGS